jgi:hypothetical protein
MHKRFKCLDPITGRIYISRDVVFDESLFPFTKLHPIAGAKLQSEILLLPSSLSFMDSGVNIMDNPDANFPNYHHKFAGSKIGCHGKQR